MTVGEFLGRLQGSRFIVDVTRLPDGSILIECNQGYRDTAWTTIAGPIANGDILDDEVARTMCRELRIPPGDVGL